MVAANKEATEPRVLIGEVEVITSNVYCRHQDLVNRYRMPVSQMTTDMSVWCRNLNSVISSFITYHRICNKSITIGTALTLPEQLSSSPVFSGVCAARSWVFCAVFCPFVLFLFANVLSVLLLFYGLFLTPLVSSNFFSFIIIRKYTRSASCNPQLITPPFLSTQHPWVNWRQRNSCFCDEKNLLIDLLLNSKKNPV